MKDDKVVFDDVTYSQLLKEIYVNAKSKDSKIKDLINTLSPLVKSISDAATVVPLIKEYLDIGVKNDDHIIKLAALVQKGESTAKSSTLEGMLTDEEKAALLNSPAPMKVISK